MNRVTLNIIATLVFFSITQCNDPLERMELSKRKILTRCFISPQDTLLIAYVNWAQPFELYQVTSRTFAPPEVMAQDTVNQIKNATVTLSDQDHAVELPYVKFDEGNLSYHDNIVRGGYYALPADRFPILPGKTYTLTVEAPDGTIAKASCTIPLQAPSFDFHYRNLLRQSFPGSSLRVFDCNYEIAWRDFPGKGDYYRTGYVLATSQYGYHYYTLSTSVTLDQSLYNDIISDEEKYDVHDSFEFYDDTEGSSVYILTLSAYVLHVDKNYYNYHRSIADQVKIQNNPFYEPILIYTNFEGGVGVFAGSNMARVTLPFVF